ncbi:unnamed protein product [Moneuplotes crassus]|uniref:HTH La-type RNA-binding domain-containing protein n=1 Tax=Euplotes crassus TaxID=5936 RepID=A0AAD1X909_EUPCR|nr:unnamed protein product [Moneuplotes crassus]
MYENQSPNTNIKSLNPLVTKAENNSATKDAEMGIEKRDIKQEICEQIEFYFSYPNLYHDTFLRKLILKNPEQKIEIETLLSFNKIKELFIESQLESQNQLEDSPESQTEFLLTCIQNSKLVKHTKDKKGVKPKMKYYPKTANERLQFIICIEGDLPDRADLRGEFKKYGKYDGFYIKSLDPKAHLIYVGFIKPRYRKRFMKEFENISIFDHSKTRIVPIREAAVLKKELKSNIQKLRDLNEDTKVCDNEEIITPEVFLCIKNIPEGYEKTNLYNLFKEIKPKYIDYQNDGKAVVRFINPDQKQKFLQQNPESCFYLPLEYSKAAPDSQLEMNNHIVLPFEEVESEEAERIIDAIKAKRAELEEAECIPGYKSYSKYVCRAKKTQGKKRHHKATKT